MLGDWKALNLATLAKDLLEQGAQTVSAIDFVEVDLKVESSLILSNAALQEFH